MRASASEVRNPVRRLTRRWLLAAALLPAAACLWWVAGAAGFTPPSYDEVRAAYTRSDATLIDRNGRVIHELRVDSGARRLHWIPLEQISPALIEAVIRAEDRRFRRHGGVDWLAAARAAAGWPWGEARRGASTITMQLTARLDRDLRPQDARRSFLQKLLQAMAARALERSWRKDQILEAYLNLVSFRGELQGIAAASLGLFDKQPHGLNLEEACLLAALVRAPNAAPDRAARRAIAIAQSLQKTADAARIEQLAAGVLTRPYFVRREAALAPHVALRLLGIPDPETGRTPARAACTLDGSLQRFASDSLRHHVLSVRSRNLHDGALIVIENSSGDVLAYVGNAGDASSARYVDGVQAKRQAGSTLKPFIYGSAFESRLMTAASLIDDSPLEIPVSGGVYRPANYDDRFHGIVTAREALAASLNVPAVKTLDMVGVEAVVGRLRDAGFRDLRPPDYYGPALALGALDVTLWDLANAYRALASRGTWSPARLTFDTGARISRRLFSEEAAFVVSDILSDRESRTLTFGLENPLATRFWTAVKTGTSKDMRDNWCVGYSDLFTVGVWAGNFSGEPMWDVSGVTGAAPVWVDVMTWLHRGSPGRAPRPPRGLVARRTRFADSGRERTEWFLRGTETGKVERALAHRPARIAYPTDGTIIALDPDIPAGHQKLFFEADPPGDTLHWELNGNPAGDARGLVLWSPVPGKHILDLVDRTSTVVDSVEFVVRGGRSKPDEAAGAASK